MTIDNDLINEILKIAYKAVPKKCALDGTKLIEVHNEMGEFLKIKLLNKAHVSGSLGFDEGYSKGYGDAQREAAQEIREHYHPNDR